MVLKYVSTREGALPMNFAGTVRAGIASDGGLYVPNHFPQMPEKDLRHMAEMNYIGVACKVLYALAPDFDRDRLHWAISQTYTSEIFGNVTDGDKPHHIVPIRRLEAGLFLARLSNGPTLAFKDIALQLLGRLFEIVLEGGSLNVLGATSGDTGSAAIHAMRGRKGIQVFMLSPKRGMSPFQQAQMWSVDDSSIHNLVVNGSFDDCQAIVKAINRDANFKQHHQLGAVNSINWARIAAQVVYYFWAYSKFVLKGVKAIDVAVPTGNFGNVYAAYVAKQMGVPIRRIVLATNQNDVLPEFWRTGTYQPREQPASTTSPSMDITAASNFERFLHGLAGSQANLVPSLMESVELQGKFESPALAKKAVEAGMFAARFEEAEYHPLILTAWSDWGVTIDPHTAVAMAAAVTHRDPGVPMVVMETAQACKFDDTVRRILGAPAPRPAGMENLEDTTPHIVPMEPDVEALKRYIVANT